MTGVGALLLGVDASHRRVGYAISADGIIVAYNTWHVDTTDDIADRARLWTSLRDEIRTLEAAHKADLLHVGIEDAYMGPNRRVGLQHARTIGQMEALAHKSFPDATQERIPAASWRKTLGIEQRGKTAPMREARRILDESHSSLNYAAPSGWCNVTDQDMADAICIVTALHKTRAGNTQ